MRIVTRKWFSRSLIFFVVILTALIMATAALASGPGGPDGPADHCLGGQVSAVAWYDGNANEQFNPNNNNPKRGEHWMDGAIVRLWSVQHGTPASFGYNRSNLIATKVTRDGGTAVFTCVHPGLYSLEVIPPRSAVRDTLSLPFTYNPNTPFEVLGGDELVFGFAFKPYLEFNSYPYLNAPPRLDP